jgi:dTDP-4-amino-4,6-dideoxygalactose transaminase
MINLFNINNYQISTSDYSNFLHDNKVTEFEEKIADYVGAKYAVSFNSATSAIFLLFLGKQIDVKVPSILPPVVVNAIITSGNQYEFYDDINWVGDSYVLHNFGNYKIVDSAQKLEKDQFKKECNPEDLMIFSFYPTKPIGSCDGGMIVSDDLNKILNLKEMALNGMSFSENNWDRKIKFPGYKMYMNSIQCDIALRNFEKYESKLERLSDIREHYNKNFGLNNTSSHLYRINTNNRDTLIKTLKENNIQTGIHYTSLHNHEVYKLNDIPLPKSEVESLTTLSIPFHEGLTNVDVDIIIKIING